MNVAIWNNDERPAVRVNWASFVANDFDDLWRGAVENALINAYTRWMSAGVSCRYRFEGYTDRTQPNDGEILVTANQRHFTTSRLASTFTSGRTASLVIHRRNGSDPTFPMWNWAPHNALPGQIDLQAVLTHELGHCFWLDDLAAGNNTMVGAHEYTRQRFGPWPGDVADVKSIYSDIGSNRLRVLRSADGSVWTPHPARLTFYNHPTTRTAAAPATAGHAGSGRLLTIWSAPVLTPMLMPDAAVTAGNPAYFQFGGERAVHGSAIAVGANGTVLWAWAHADDTGTIRIARSTNAGDAWTFVGSPAGATTAGTLGLASSQVDGRTVWMLAWAHMDRATAAANGELRVSISRDDGQSWGAPANVGPSYRSLSGVGLAASPANQFIVVFAWAQRTVTGMNLVRSLDLSVGPAGVVVGRASTHTGRSRVQPAIAYLPRNGRFVLVYREQNYLTSLRFTSRRWNGLNGWPAASQIPVTTHTAPGLGVDPRSGDLMLWYGAE
jgi:hypothetical protein